MTTKARRVLVSLFVCAGVASLHAVGADSETNSLGMQLVGVESGTFPMGSEISRDLWNEQPVHEVTISKPFLVTETEVTIDQFRLFRNEFQGTAGFEPYAAGVSWHDAVAFARWLSRKEGRTYRLPTEAEWEYVARAGSEEVPAGSRELGRPNAWGVKNMLSGPREWCHDGFGEYPAAPQVDPVGPASGSTRVARGGSLDIEERNLLKIDFARPQSRLAIAPSFGPFPRSGAAARTPAAGSGLVGVWYYNIDLTDPQERTVITRLDNNWRNDPRGAGSWSARWRGSIEGPHTGVVTFHVETASPFRLKIGGQVVVDAWETRAPASGEVALEKGRRHPVVLSFAREGANNHFRLEWSWIGREREVVPSAAVAYSTDEDRLAESEAKTPDAPGFHAIGFRLVQAEMPQTAPWPVAPTLAQMGVKKRAPSNLGQGPALATPYFRKRYLLPTPLENSPDAAIDALALHPSFRRHTHSPGATFLPNGDLLMVIYTSYREYEPGVSLIVSRLRFGADQWDMPSRIVDFVGANDHAPLLWNDDGTVHLFWGSPKLEFGGFPFQWTSTTDNGATWQATRFPDFVSEIGSHSRQPINTAFRDETGRIYLSSDGSGGESVLWASDDDGQTWFDTGGRSAGRHTTYTLLKDGRILGMGGKNTDIDGFMPRAISSDGGRTWEVSKTPFCQLGSNQRPSVLRLESGRLLFAGDFIHHNTGSQPEGLGHVGSYVALSEDEGENWRIKKLIGVQPHENPARARRMKGPTLGYTVARQAPNGMIHLIATMTHPNLHFEMNEAWILEGPAAERPDQELMASTASSVSGVETWKEHYPSGPLKGSWSGGVGDDGRFLLHGTETWYYEDGSKQWETQYELGRKVGAETHWSPDGETVWAWEHAVDGTSLWTQYWPDGRKKAQSTWRNFMADGEARRWDRSGQLVSETSFESGEMKGRGLAGEE